MLPIHEPCPCSCDAGLFPRIFSTPDHLVSVLSWLTLLQGLYARVCDYREKRLDEEDLLAEFQKSIEQIKKDKEQASKKLKVVEQSLAAINSDMTNFQKEKQGKLNELDVTVMLSLRQIEYLVEGKVPADLSGAVLIEREVLDKLNRRIVVRTQNSTLSHLRIEDKNSNHFIPYHDLDRRTVAQST